MVIIIVNELIVIVYVLIMSCGTPMVYFLGIEDNRNAAKEVLMTKTKVFTRINKKKVEPVIGFESRTRKRTRRSTI